MEKFDLESSSWKACLRLFELTKDCDHYFGCSGQNLEFTIDQDNRYRIRITEKDNICYTLSESSFQRLCEKFIEERTQLHRKQQKEMLQKALDMMSALEYHIERDYDNWTNDNIIREQEQIEKKQEETEKKQKDLRIMLNQIQHQIDLL